VEKEVYKYVVGKIGYCDECALESDDITADAMGTSNVDENEKHGKPE
jgi:hypothetical protein